MGIINFGSSNLVTFNPKGHRYNDNTGVEYRSVSKVLNTLEEPFDSKGISMAMAKSAHNKGDSRPIEVIRKEILAEWDGKLNNSQDWGNWIHDGLEDYQKLGTFDEKLKPVIEQLRKLYTAYHKVYTEVLLSDQESKTAGQTDLVIQRTRGMGSLFDFYDYKTNYEKGIQFDSINRKKDPWKHYNRFYYPPLEHLEDCNYNRYCLQLSLYACMAQRMYGIKIGKLAMIFINKQLRITRYPVPYMKLEAELLLDHNKRLKPLPRIPPNNDENW